MERHVWSLAEAEVEVYREQPSVADPKIGEIVLVGNPPEPMEPIFPYCILQGATLICGTQLVRRAVTGRGRRKIVNPAMAFDEITLTINHLYFRKAAELDTTILFSPRSQLRLVLSNVDWLYSDDFPFENDRFTLSFVFAQSFQITGQQADVMEGTGTFLAELII